MKTESEPSKFKKKRKFSASPNNIKVKKQKVNFIFFLIIHFYLLYLLYFVETVSPDKIILKSRSFDILLDMRWTAPRLSSPP